MVLAALPIDHKLDALVAAIVEAKRLRGRESASGLSAVRLVVGVPFKT